MNNYMHLVVLIAQKMNASKVLTKCSGRGFHGQLWLRVTQSHGPLVALPAAHLSAQVTPPMMKMKSLVAGRRSRVMQIRFTK